jgi:hypothetical protein
LHVGCHLAVEITGTIPACETKDHTTGKIDYAAVLEKIVVAL